MVCDAKVWFLMIQVEISNHWGMQLSAYWVVLSVKITIFWLEVLLLDIAELKNRGDTLLSLANLLLILANRTNLLSTSNSLNS